ncbi:MAG: DUF3800 domain-containing protein [Planctomycetota bacterium]
MSLTVFFDESYDQPHKEFTIFGILICRETKAFLHSLRSAKEKHGYKNPDGSYKELKYTNCMDWRCRKVAKDAIDFFFETDDTSFACIVIEKKLVDRSRFGKPYEPEALINARIYKKFAEMLIRRNLQGRKGIVLLIDHATRCHGDRLLELLGEEFSGSGHKDKPFISHLQEVHSHLDAYQLLQICDLLCGCVLNQNRPAKKWNSGKNKVRRYLVNKLGVKNLSSSTWTGMSKTSALKRKFNVWYWRPK